MAKPDAQVAAHLEWIGFVKPTGLVVSATALARAGVILNRRDITGQQLLRDWADTYEPELTDPAQRPYTPEESFSSFARQVLGWNFSPKGYAGTAEEPIPEELKIQLPDSDLVFGPDYAVRLAPLTRRAAPPDPASPTASSNDDGDEERSPWQLLISVTDPDLDFDRARADGSRLSAHARMERLLRHTRAPAGLLFNGQTVRLISAPVGETSGWLDFEIAAMRQTAGRPICSAMRELLGQIRLLTAPTDKRLAALLRDSRKFQNEVSERLAEQVLHALYELLRGFQAAHDASRGELLDRQLREAPDEIYRGLLTVVLRLVFLLYTEERDMLPQDEVFLNAYSVTSLYERLRADAALHPDTMDQRYGAYPQLVALWRMIQDGAQGPNFGLSPRHGDLFDPGRYPFLEGRPTTGGARQVHERVNAPLVPDGTVYRVLEQLIVLDAERISYRALDIEHIGSVYETMMGFRLETATGPSVAIKAKKYGAPATINIEELLRQPPAKRAGWLRERTDRELTPKVNKALRAIDSDSINGVDAMHVVLGSVIDHNATPDLVTPGSMVLQPSEERRKSGSHYTPRELTEPIVRAALAPVLDRLRTEENGPIRPDQILDLKICDPAMGSGAFLVEACRQLAAALIEAWRVHSITPDIPSEEEEIIFARRLVAQRCLYGVDRNPKAVDLAKLSLWLTTLATEHPLTFLDHSFRHGDSLVGLSIEQLQAFHWKGNAPVFAAGFEALRGRTHLDEAAELRQLIRDSDGTVTDTELRALWSAAHYEISTVRHLGDMALSAFFEGSNARTRETRRKELAGDVLNSDTDTHRSRLDGLRYADPPFVPFHWEIEFPEVFDRSNAGFDVIVGNPPFGGHVTVVDANVPAYTDWLRHSHSGTKGKCDVVAHFFRRSFNLVRLGGTLGLIATNTIAQGDTRTSGLSWICNNGGNIYHANRRLKWPGPADVVVSVIHISKGTHSIECRLDGTHCETISAFLLDGGGNDDPARLQANVGKGFQGTTVLGMGFTFDDTDQKEIASSLDHMERLICEDPRNQRVIFPYIGGDELNSHPTHRHHRYVINFFDFPLKREELLPTWQAANEQQRTDYLRSGIVPSDYSDPVAADWPELLKIVEENVKPSRLESARKSRSSHGKRAAVWWKLYHRADELYRSIGGLDTVLANSQVSEWMQFTFLPSDMVYAHRLYIYPLDTYAAFCVLQSRVHEAWALLLGSSLEDRLCYTLSDCFETFPFPQDLEALESVESAGRVYYEYRASLMREHHEGMTATYNRFHNPDESDSGIAKLRELHAAMDRASLDAYGWHDISVECEFLFDYEIDDETWGKKKKPIRYRWPNHVRDEVLARLMKFNGYCAAAEARDALIALEGTPADPRRGRRGGLGTESAPGSVTLFGDPS